MRLLIVEDESAISEPLARGLRADGFSVDVADDGTDGLWMARENPYSAIILDIMLPGMNGYRICSTLREEGIWTPILMLTAKDGEWDETEGLESGADDYITKPFSYPVLLARVRGAIRRAGQATPVSAIELGDLRVDSAERRCWRGDTEVDLSPRAFAVLDVLARRAGHAVSKSEIVADVWDAAYDGDPNIVEVYISRIRQAIDVPFDRRAVETVRGVGYRLDRNGG